MSFPSGLSLPLCAVLGLLLAIPAGLARHGQAPQPATTVASAKKIAPEPPARLAAPQIDLRKAVALALPELMVLSGKITVCERAFWSLEALATSDPTS